MKTICFTNNDLAKAMGLEVGKKYKASNFADELICSEELFKDGQEKQIVLGIGVGGWHFLWKFIDETLTEVKPKPQLTEQEITILKGRLAEGYTHIKREYSSVGKGKIYFSYETVKGKYDDCSNALADMMFEFIKQGEEYSIEELLKGVE